MHKAGLKNPTSRDIIEAEQMRRYIAVPARQSDKKDEISDIFAYNHENGIMWGVYSLVFWAAVFAGIWSSTAALILIAAGCVVGLPVITYVHKRIYAKYRV